MSQDVKARPKASRAGAPKTKTGCTTCKARHVKCDETKPACKRCLKFWGKCEGYQSSIKPGKPGAPVSRLLLPQPKINDGVTLYESELPTPFGSGILDQLRFLSVEPTRSNAELFYIHTKVSQPFDFSIDGSGGIPTWMAKDWQTLTIQGPISIYIQLFKASLIREELRKAIPRKAGRGALHVTGNVVQTPESAETICLRLKSISLLNTRLTSTRGAPDDEVIACVLYIAILDFSWNDDDILVTTRPHVNGINEMIRLRGGLGDGGVGRLLTLFIILARYLFAAVFECEPFICPEEYIQEYYDPSYIPTAIGLDSPLFLSSGCFADKCVLYGIYSDTAQILDHMNFITKQVLSYAFGETSELEWTKFMRTALGIQDRISAMSSSDRLGQGKAIDRVHETCRLSALIYVKAIVTYTPLGQACQSGELAAILAVARLVPLYIWKRMPGVWIFILLVLNPAARYHPGGKFWRSLLRISAGTIGAVDIQVSENIFEIFLIVQRWLREPGKKQELGRKASRLHEVEI